MALDITKLENVVPGGDERIVARCPACASEGGDNKGNHLIIFADGRFGCAVYPGQSEDAKAHRKLIWKLAGDRPSGGSPSTGGGPPSGGSPLTPKFRVQHWSKRFLAPLKHD